MFRIKRYWTGVLFLMQKDKKFYQDFLFETISTDEQEYPAVELSYSTIEVPDIEISLTYLMSILTQPAWDKLIASTKNKKVVIYDDVPVNNTEVLPYKLFYLKVYYYLLKEQCAECTISTVQSNQKKSAVCC